MEKTSPKDLFLASIRRCEQSADFMPAFYERFLAVSDEIRLKFKATCFETQSQRLLRSLKLVAGATEGDPEALQELRARAETHDRYHLNIRPEMYEAWLECAVETAREYDNKWNDDTESAWTKSLGYAVAYMVRRY